MKKISRRSFLMATGVIAASAALSACGGSSASTSSAGSTAASTAASGTAAQGGGDIVIYSPNSEGLLNATIPLFEEKYGVSIDSHSFIFYGRCRDCCRKAREGEK